MKTQNSLNEESQKPQIGPKVKAVPGKARPVTKSTEKEVKAPIPKRMPIPGEWPQHLVAIPKPNITTVSVRQQQPNRSLGQSLQYLRVYP